MAQWVPPPLQADLVTRRRGQFVGRAAELAVFEQAWQRVQDGGRQVVFVGGEPGAGKSRLVAGVAGTLADHDIAVLVGGCTAEAGIPYQPFADVLDRLLSAGAPGQLAEALGDAAGQLIRLSPNVDRHRSGTAGTADAEALRPLLFDALSGFLRRLAAGRPLVLVLEDLHWAQAPTLAMLEHLLISCADVRMLVIATFRTTEPNRSEELVGRLADMHRFDGVRRLDLSGLDTEAIVEFVSRTEALPAPQARTAAALLRERTGGNPFFLTELCNDLQNRGGITALSSHRTVPPPIGDAIGRRLAGLGESVQRIIEQAAVLGESFDLPALIAGSDTDLATTLAAVDSAEGVGVIRAVPGSDGEFCFVHALTREAVIARMTASRLRVMHARAADALAGRADPSVVPRLANHYLLAHVLGYHEQALRYARDAARIAEHSLAYEDAANWYGRATSLPELNVADRARLILDAAANHVRAGDFDRARALYESLSAVDDPLIRLEAACGYENANWRPGLAHSKAADLLAAALEACGLDSGDPRYVRALASFGRALGFAGETQRAREVSTLAIEHARATGSPAVISHALETSLWHGLTPDMCQTQYERATELCAMATERRDYEALNSASHFRALVSYQAGRPGDFADAVADMQRCSRTSGQPFFDFVSACVESGVAYLHGDFAGAQRWAGTALGTGTRLGADSTEGSHGVQMFMIHRETGALGRFAEFLDGSETFAGRWVPGLLALYTELGSERGIARALNHLLNRNLGDHTAEAQWPMELVFMAEAALWLADRDATATLRPFLAEYAGKNLMSGQFVALFGSADRYLARIAALHGQTASAERHFDIALTMDRRMGSAIHVAETLARRAAFAAACDRGEDARLLADEARAIATPIGHARVLDLVRPILAAGPDNLTEREVEVLRLLAAGLSNREIGERLFISANTAANHVRNILLKTGAANRTQAAMYAADHELLY